MLCVLLLISWVKRGVEDYSEANWLQINKINQASPSAARKFSVHFLLCV